MFTSDSLRSADPSDVAARAVQERAGAFVMDWPTCQESADVVGRFDGNVFVLVSDDRPLVSGGWAAPTDTGADLTLNALGWILIGPWTPDIFGRRHAPVTRRAPPLSQPRTCSMVMTGPATG